MMHDAALLLAWLLALAWVVRIAGALRGMRTVAQLDRPEWDLRPEHCPGLAVVVPAKDEGAHIEATLRSLVAQDFRDVGEYRVIAVDDRSADGTGAYMDAWAADFPECVSALHVHHLPAGWLGKTHALDLALRTGPQTDYVLFTDADVSFEPSILRRTIAFAERERADHVVVIPTMVLKRWNEGILLGVFHTFVLWAARPWRVPDPRAKRDVIGVGAFNLVRRSALEQLGGLAPQALVVLEDITIARRFKAAGMRSRVAFAPGMVRVHWADGLRGQMGVMGKNLFSAFNFRIGPAFGASISLALLGIVPVWGLFYAHTRIPALVMCACIAAMYWLCRGFSRIPASYAWTYPLGTVLFCYTILRSLVLVLRDRGVRWRGTLYPLAELRRHNDPFQWERK